MRHYVCLWLGYFLVYVLAAGSTDLTERPSTQSLDSPLTKAETSALAVNSTFASSSSSSSSLLSSLVSSISSSRPSVPSSSRPSSSLSSSISRFTSGSLESTSFVSVRANPLIASASTAFPGSPRLSSVWIGSSSSSSAIPLRLTSSTVALSSSRPAGSDVVSQLALSTNKLIIPTSQSVLAGVPQVAAVAMFSSSQSNASARAAFKTTSLQPSASIQPNTVALIVFMTTPVVTTSSPGRQALKTTIRFATASSTSTANMPVFGTATRASKSSTSISSPRVTSVMSSTSASKSTSSALKSTTSSTTAERVSSTGSVSSTSRTTSSSALQSRFSVASSRTVVVSGSLTRFSSQSASASADSAVLFSNSRCLVDTISARTLNGASYGGSGTNTPYNCAMFCLQQGASLAGTEFGSECFCGNSLTSNQTSGACTTRCSGDSKQICGGDGAISVVDINPDFVTIDPNAPTGYLGCFDDGAATRILLNASFSSSTMTNDICSNYCSGINLPYAGTEYGGNCYCGATIKSNQRPATACYSNCYGNAAQQCGGNGVLSLYKVPLTFTVVAPYTDAGKTTSSAGNIFAAVSRSSPPGIFPQRPHDITPLSIEQGLPIHTNKQYAQAFISSQSQALFMIPYAVQYQVNAFAVQHSDIGQYVLAGQNSDGRALSYSGPLNQLQVTFTSSELQAAGKEVIFSASSSLHASVDLQLSLPNDSDKTLTMPIVNGMGLVTARYVSLNPIIQSPVVKISSFSLVTPPGHSGITQKLRLQLGDSSVWVIYFIPDAGSPDLVFTLSGDTIRANAVWTGTVQTAKITTVSDPVSGEAVLDQAAGTWVTSMKLSGSTRGSTGTWSFNYVKAGDTSKSPLVFALPHHMEVLVNSGSTGLLMQSPLTGVATGFVTDALVMTDANLPTNIGFMTTSAGANWSKNTLLIIKKAITPDILGKNYTAACNGYSTYFSGKCLAKTAQLCMVAKDIVKDSNLTTNCVKQLRAVMTIYATNQQLAPLDYETTWKGIVIDGGFQQAGYDFGATDYNDHHFHYGYLVYAAAAMGYLDPTWLTAANVDWVNTIIRDVASPVEDDPYFPQFRSMDWYVGHSIAHGILSDQNTGKDQESSSEDYNFSYGLKLWGQVTGNTNLEGLGNVMCAINLRSMNNYLLLGPGNKNFPEAYNKNYATGVTYGNLVGYYTFFGGQTQYVNGIHMLPLTAISPYIRRPGFVQGEWDNLLEPLYPGIESTGWAGIISSDLAISDPQTSWNFFANGNVVNFNYYNLDDGQTLTWALTFAAGLGGGR